MSTKKLTTNENPESHLIKGANILVKGFETPANLLEFLAHTLNWLEDYNNERFKEGQDADTSTFFIRLLIEQLLHPWLEENKYNIPSIAMGLKEIQSTFGYDGYIKNLSIILKGFAVNMTDGPYTNGEAKKHMLSFGTMFETGNSINDYEIREKQKLSEAA